MLVGAVAVGADLPPELPGEEITEEYTRMVLPRDSIEKKTPPTSRDNPTWLDNAMETWEAPVLSQQLAEDNTPLPMGKGAVYVPCLTEPEREPDIEILDENGKVAGQGLTGRKYPVLPGTYYVMLGSGAHDQRMVRVVEVTEGQVTPIVPDWSALVVDVVDEANIEFSGEYEIARLEGLEAYGRGTGRDPDLGEELRTWILKPGIYKMFGVGQSYNTLTNFVTTRLLAGEHTRFMLVMNNQSDQRIVGGGIVDVGANRALTRNWRYGIDIGGSVLYNAETDHETDSTATSSSIALLSIARLNYDKDPWEWDSRVKLDEGITFTGFDISRLSSSPDNLRITSLFTWRFLRWLGPYGRLEVETPILPLYHRVPEGVEQYYWVILSPDSTLEEIDSLSSSYILRRPFSPLELDAGVGANVTLVGRRWAEADLLAGFGFSQEVLRESGEVVGSGADFATILREEASIPTLDYGPEFAFNGLLRVGRFATAETELKVLVPVGRFGEPDVDLTNTMSWHLTRFVSLDYEYTYTLKQPKDLESEQTSEHRVWIRYSYTSRN